MAIKAAPKTDSRLAARCAALASLGAAVVHFAVVPAHWQEWPLYGVFFGALALLQLIWARSVLVRTTTPALTVGLLLNVSAIALWALSRSAGIPFGPHAGAPEVVQGADLAALLLQIYVVMGAGWILYRGLEGERVGALASAAVLSGAAGVVALATTVGVVSGQQHGNHHDPAEGVAGHHGTEIGHPKGGTGNHHEHESAPVVPLDAHPITPPPVEIPAQPLPDHGGHAH